MTTEERAEAAARAAKTQYILKGPKAATWSATHKAYDIKATRKTE